MKTLYFVELTYGNALIDEKGVVIQYTHENDGNVSYDVLKPFMDHAGVDFFDLGTIDAEDLELNPDDCEEHCFKHVDLYKEEFLRRIGDHVQRHRHLRSD